MVHVNVPVRLQTFLQKLLRSYGGRLDIESSAVKMCEFAARFFTMRILTIVCKIEARMLTTAIVVQW